MAMAMSSTNPAGDGCMNANMILKMVRSTLVLVVVLVIGTAPVASGFSPSTLQPFVSTRVLSAALSSGTARTPSSLGLLKLPFLNQEETTATDDDNGEEAQGLTPTLPLDIPFEPTPDGLIAQAKVMLAVDLGLQKDGLLDQNFVWIGPTLGSKVLGKQDYLAAGKFFNLR